MAIGVTAQLQQWNERIDALDLRERILLLAATVVVLFLIIDTLGLQPSLRSQQAAEQHITDMLSLIHI